jgi:hypothetical protein
MSSDDALHSSQEEGVPPVEKAYGLRMLASMQKVQDDEVWIAQVRSRRLLRHSICSYLLTSIDSSNAL